MAGSSVIGSVNTSAVKAPSVKAPSVGVGVGAHATSLGSVHFSSSSSADKNVVI